MNNLVVYEGANRILSNLCIKNNEAKQFSKVISEEGLSLKSAIKSYQYLQEIGYVESCGKVEKLENDFYLRATQIGSAMLRKEKSEGKNIFLSSKHHTSKSPSSRTRQLTPQHKGMKDRIWMNNIMFAVVIVLIIILCKQLLKYLALQ